MTSVHTAARMKIRETAGSHRQTMSFAYPENRHGNQTPRLSKTPASGGDKESPLMVFVGSLIVIKHQGEYVLIKS